MERLACALSMLLPCAKFREARAPGTGDPPFEVEKVGLADAHRKAKKPIKSDRDRRGILGTVT